MKLIKQAKLRVSLSSSQISCSVVGRGVHPTNVSNLRGCFFKRSEVRPEAHLSGFGNPCRTVVVMGGRRVKWPHPGKVPVRCPGDRVQLTGQDIKGVTLAASSTENLN